MLYKTFVMSNLEIDKVGLLGGFVSNSSPISHFKATREGVQYKISDFPEIEYLDLAEYEIVQKSYVCGKMNHLQLCRIDSSMFRVKMETSSEDLILQHFEKFHVKYMISRPKEIMEKYLKVLKIFSRLEDDRSARKACTLLVTILCKIRYSDPWFIRNILNKVCANSNVIETFFFGAFSNRCLQYIVHQACAIQWNLFGLLGDTSTEKLQCCPVLSYLFTRELDRLKFLLDHGVKRRMFKKFCLPYRTVIENPVFMVFEKNVSFRSEETMIELRRFQGYRTLTDRDHAIFEWVYVICVHQEVDENIKDLKIGMELLYRSLPDPFVSTTEMQESLSLLPKNVPDDIQEIITTYRKLNPDATEYPNPRSLKHLCRCSFRNYLRRSYHIVENIDRLRLPRDIISYLKLEY